jgi:hypothetical protein
MKLGCDRMIRNALLRANDQTEPLRVDVGVNVEVRKNHTTGTLERIATIVDIGDLSTWSALEEEIDAHGATLDATRVTMDHSFPASEFPLLMQQR